MKSVRIFETWDWCIASVTSWGIITQGTGKQCACELCLVFSSASRSTGFFAVLCFLYLCVLPACSSSFSSLNSQLLLKSKHNRTVHRSENVLQCFIFYSEIAEQSQDMLRPRKPYLQCGSFFGFLTSQDEVISHHSLPKATLGFPPEETAKCRIGLWMFGLFCTHPEGHCADSRPS